MTKAQKKAAARKLIRQLKHNPKLIKNHRWLRAAGHVDASLKLTVRLNPVVATTASPTLVPYREVASDDTADLDLSGTFGPEVGSKSTTLTGKVNVTAHFGNPAEGDALGDLRLAVDNANLYAASVGVLDTAGFGAECAALGPGAARAAISLVHPSVIPSVVGTGGTGAFASTTLGGTVAASTLAPSVNPDTTVRTGPIHLQSVEVAGAPNIGKANLFTTSNNVRLSLHTTASLNTIFRSTEDRGSPFAPAWDPGTFPTAKFLCNEAYAGQTNASDLPTLNISNDAGGAVGHRNIIPVNVTGSLAIAPAFTTDGKLRLATVDVSSPAAEHSTIDACLQPVNLTETPKSLADESSLGMPAHTIVSGSGEPSTVCDAAYSAATFPLALLGATEITPAASKFLSLEPEVQVTGLTAEALVGQGPGY